MTYPNADMIIAKFGLIVECSVAFFTFIGMAESRFSNQAPIRNDNNKRYFFFIGI